MQQNYMYSRMSQTEIGSQSRMSQTEIGSQYENHSTHATQTKDKEPIVRNCENGCQNTEFEVPCNCTVSQSKSRNRQYSQPEPKSNRKKRKKKRYLKQLSSKVGIPNDSSSTTQNRNRNRALSEAGEALGRGSPFIYCRFIVKFPILAFLLSSTLHVFAIVTTVSLVITGDNVFPTDFKKLPLILYDDSSRKRDLAWRSRDAFSMRITRPVYGIYYPTWVGGQVKDILEVILKVDDGSIFSKNNLYLIQQIENLLFNFKDYKSTYCQRDELYECVKPWSIIRLFDGTYKSVDSSFYNPNFDHPTDVLCNAKKFTETKEFVEYLFPKGYNPCQSGSASTMTRIFLTMGYPLLGSNSKSRINNFLINEVKPHVESIRDNIIGDRMHLYYTSQMIFDNDVTQQAFDDMLFAIGSFLFIFLVMWIQTKSFFITTFGIFSILTSFLLANLVYRYIFSYEYFGFFHIISMFIILGIGADDVFVFYDSWRLTDDFNYPSLAHRLTDCYYRAAKTTFVTSVTTMAAFLVSGMSPLLPVASFGLFSGILVGVNYICDLVYFPTAIVLYSQKIRPKTIKCYDWISKKVGCLKGIKCKLDMCKKSENLRGEDSEKTTPSNSSVSFLCSPRQTAKEDSSRLFPKLPPISQIRNLDHLQFSNTFNTDKNFKPKQSTDKTNTTRKEFEERMLVVRFLRHGFYSFLSLRIVRLVLLVVFLGMSGFLIYSATNLEPDSKQVQIFRSSHNHGKASFHHYYSFQRNFEEEYTSVYLVWGMLEKDTSPCSRKSSDFCSGTMVWDQSFNSSSPEAQMAIYNLCRRLENASDSEIQRLKIRRNSLTNKPEVSCYLTAMERFLQEDVTNNRQGYPPDLDVNVPMDRGNMTKFMISNKNVYKHPNTLPAHFNRWLEIGLGYWITNRYTGRIHEDYFLYNHLIGEQYVRGETTIAQNTHLGLYYGTKMRYFGIQVNLTVSVFTLGLTEGKPVYQAWEQLMIDAKEKMPASLGNGFQCTRNTWHWIRVQEVLSESAVMGIIIGLSVALPVLVLTTMNIIIGFIAWTVIVMVTVCVVGSIPLLGWKLGVLESLNLCMVVGLAVDYVVHLAEAYNVSPYVRRQDRTRNMLEKMGLSVLSGAFTTFGAALFMLGAQIQFIYQFGIFVMITVCASMLFSMFAFTSLMLVLGPEGNTGSVKALVKRLFCCNVKQNGKNQDSDVQPNPA